MTIDGTREIKPLTLFWQEPNKFLISGVDKRKHLHRVALRFESPEKAQRVAEELKSENLSLNVESQPPPATTIPVEIKFLYSTGELFGIFYRSLFSVALLWFFVTVVVAGSSDILAIILGVVLSYMFGMAILILRVMRRRTTGTLRFENQSVLLIPPYTRLSPRRVEWRNSLELNLKMRGRKIRLKFRTEEQAGDAVQLLRQRFPKLVETHIEHSA